MTVAENFVEDLGSTDRQILLQLARGLSDDEIAKVIAANTSYVESHVRRFRRFLSQRTPNANIRRPDMALYVVEYLLSPTELIKWRQWAQANRALLGRCNLLDGRALEVVKALIQPENFSLNFNQLAAVMGWHSGAAVRHAIDPLIQALGDSRIRLQVTFYLLAEARV